MVSRRFDSITEYVSFEKAVNNLKAVTSDKELIRSVLVAPGIRSTMVISYIDEAAKEIALNGEKAYKLKIAELEVKRLTLELSIVKADLIQAILVYDDFF